MKNTSPQVTSQELEFFKAYEHQAKTFGLLNTFEDREDRARFRSIKKRVEWTAPVKKKRITLTIEELTPIFNEYLASNNENGKVKVFDRNTAASGLANHRKDPIATAMAVQSQLVWFDQSNKSMVKCFDRTGKNLKELMAQYNEATLTSRFKI